MLDKILIIDFGSQYTQLIARRVREQKVFCEIYPYHHLPALSEDIKGIILSGSPFSVLDEHAPAVDLNKLLNHAPILGICYGAQLIAKQLGGSVSKSEKREYGRAKLTDIQPDDQLVHQLSDKSQVWMSHGDTITDMPPNFKLIASTDSIKVAAFMANSGDYTHPVYCLQFHPEVTHSLEGDKILSAFLFEISRCAPNWTAASFVQTTVDELKQKLGNDEVILGLSGGVDSSVAAVLLDKAIHKNLYCIFVDNGLLRKNEFETVLESYKHMGLNVKGVDAKQEFIKALAGVEDPERKRKIIGKIFIDVFERESKELKDAKWLAQGTIYPDVIESVSVHGPSVMIKSHHNVGGLPERLHLKIVEPLRMLFKDEVRRVGKELEIDPNILNRHPYPGPGLAIRIISDVDEEKIRILQEADAIFIDNLKKFDLYDKVWQSATILLPIQSVGVMGDERTYENVIALRSVNSSDGMTADWSDLPHEFLAKTSNDIINHVKGVNRVVYDISSKPPATIEWE